MTAEQLPTGYYRIHCRTERALFVGRHLNDLLDRAGNPEGYVREVPANEWLILGPDVIDPLCDLADARKATP